MTINLEPLKYLVLFLIIGLFTGRTCHISPHIAQIVMALFFIILLFTLLFKKNLFPFFIISLFFPIGLLLWDGYGNVSSHPGNVTNYESDEKRIVEGLVLKKVEGTDKCRLIIESASIFEGNHRINVTGEIQLTIAEPDIKIVPGDRIRFWAKLRAPRNFGNPGGFDYEGFLRDRGIYATAFMKDNRYIAVMGDGSRFWGFVYGMREKIRHAIEKSSSDAARGIIMAITLGNKGHMAEETVQSFRKTGLSHLLAISGLHMGIIAFFFYRLFTWALSRSERLLLHLVVSKWAAILTLIPLTLYLITSGMSTSAIRAYIMATAFLFSIIIDRESEIYNTIALAALIILLVWPQALFDPAFLLSFTAVLSIVYMTPRLESLLFTPKEGENKRWLRKVCTFIFVSLTASLGTAPIISYFFNEISTVGIISNLLVVPLLGFIAIPIASLAMFAAAANIPGATMLFTPVSLIASISNEIITYISSFSFASTLLSPPAPFEIILYYLLLWAVFNIKKKWVLSTALIIPLIFVSSKTFEILSERSDKNLRVTFLSVGQGESTFIEFPNGKNMLIDGGGSYDNTFDIGKMVVRPYLLFRGVKEIDYLVLSHPHSDHLNGLLHILKEFEIGEVWTTNEQIIDDNYKSFQDLLRKRDIKRKIIHDNSQDLDIEDVHVQFLHPPENFDEGRSSGSKINNRSIVMRISYGERAFLLTGDLEVEGEKEIIKGGDAISAQVIKAGHHGSLSSSSPDFIEKVSPQYTVFTVGYKNRFHFPRDEVVKRYKEMGTETFRTDLDGAITFTTNGEALQVATFR